VTWQLWRIALCRQFGHLFTKITYEVRFKSNFYSFEYWKSELDLDWLLQHFRCCGWHNSLLCHIYYQFSIFFHHIPHSKFLFFLKMIHLPNGYEILQACTQPTKGRTWTNSGTVVVWKKLELWRFQWILFIFLRKGEKYSANFEHYDLRDDNELDPNIWWGSRHTS
jgi:hypothetical protein